MNTGRIDDNGNVRGGTPTASTKEDHSGSPAGEGAEGPSQVGHDENSEPPARRQEPAVPAAPEQVRIDPEFKAIIQPPSAEEFDGLEQLILQAGRAIDPLCVSN